MRHFQWEGQALAAELDAPEAALLRQVVSEIRDLLSDADTEGRSADEPAGKSGGFDVNRQSEDDTAGAHSVRARLLPDGHRSDPALAQDYRSLTEAGLRSEKLADAEVVLDTVGPDGGRVELDQTAAEAWLRTLNDVRLAIGVRLDVQETDDPLVAAEETGDPRWAVYSWLTAVQGRLVDVLGDRPRARGA